MTVLHQDSPDHYHVVQTVEMPPFSRNMGLDPTSHRVFVVAAKFGPSPPDRPGRDPMMPGSFSLLVVEK